MRLVFVLAPMIVAVLACSLNDDGPCAQRKGTYVDRWTVRTGDCGSQAESVGTVESQPIAPNPPCTGSIKYSVDNCAVTLDVSCPVSTLGPGYQVHTSGKVDWSEDGASGSGLLSMDVTNGGAYVCHGTYDVVSTRR